MILLALGIVFVGLGLFIPSLIISTGSLTRGAHGLILLTAGFCCCAIGIILLLTNTKKTTKQTDISNRIVTNAVNINVKTVNFTLTFVFTIVAGLVTLWITNVLFGIEDPIFYQITIVGLVFGALLLALTTSYES